LQEDNTQALIKRDEIIKQMLESTESTRLLNSKSALNKRAKVSVDHTSSQSDDDKNAYNRAQSIGLIDPKT